MGTSYQNMAIRGQALLVLYEMPYSTGGKKLCARTMDINYPVVFMQTLQYLLFISTVMVRQCVRLFIQHYTRTICVTACGYLVPVCCGAKRHMQIHSGEPMPFICMKCDFCVELCASIMPFNCTKCYNLIIYLPCKIYSDSIVMIHYINLTVWECRLYEILSSKCQ